jgi:hypothetical protein
MKKVSEAKKSSDDYNDLCEVYDNVIETCLKIVDKNQKNNIPDCDAYYSQND